MNLKLITVSLCLLLSNLYSYGQAGNVNPPVMGSSFSPTGNKANNVQNNLFDGSATVTIPFYSTAIDGVKIGLNGFYNTKGIKVNQKASWMGLGWELSSGYSITRQVRDRPDEKYIPAFAWSSAESYKMINGYWYSRPSGFDDFESTDQEMDKFTLNLNGESIAFYFSRNGTLVTVPKTNIKIDRIINNISTNNITLSPFTGTIRNETILDFIVTDPAGNRYYFSSATANKQFLNKYAETATINPLTGYYSNKYDVTNEWKIDKIVTYPGRQINFEYYDWNIYNATLNKMDYIIEHNGGDMPNFSNTKVSNFDGKATYLSKIIFPNNDIVDLEIGGRTDEKNSNALLNIIMRSGYNKGAVPIFENIIKYRFNYSYFNANDPGTDIAYYDGSGTTENDHMRLKLNSIDRIADGNIMNYYSFNYNMSVRLPVKFSKSQDIFGYYNGKSPQPCYAFIPAPLLSSVPLHEVRGTPAGTYAGIDKMPNASYAQANILTSITNGAGGKTEFYYDGCAACIGASPSFPAGSSAVGPTSFDGLSLIQQIDKDGFSDENDILTRYFYGPGRSFLPGGIFNYTIKYSSSPTIERLVYMSGCLSASQQINGSNHGFSDVTVYKYRKDISSGWSLLGKTKNTFINTDQNLSTTNLTTNIFNYSASAPKYWQPPFSDKQYYREWALGLPVKTEVYDIDNNLTSKTENFYNFSDEDLTGTQYTSKKYLTSSQQNDGKALSWYTDDYNLKTGSVKLTKTNTYTYTASDNMVTTIDYTYDLYNNVKTEKTVNSLGQVITKINFYNYEWSSYGTYAGAAINRFNIDGLKVPVYSEVWKRIDGEDVLMGNAATGVVLDGATNAVPKYSYTLRSTNGLKASLYGSFPAAFNMAAASAGNTLPNFLKTSEVASFDTYGNPREVILIGGKREATIYNGAKRQLISKTSNASITEVAYTSFEGNYKSKGTSDYNKGNWDFDYNYIKLGGISSAYSISGNLIYELNANSLSNIVTSGFVPVIGKKYRVTFWTQGGIPVVKSNGVTVGLTGTALAYRGWVQYSAEFDGAGPVEISSGGTNFFIDEIRLYPADAMMTTATYEPMFGIKSTCNENDQFAINEYDAFGRIVVVRDHQGNIISKTKHAQQQAD